MPTARRCDTAGSSHWQDLRGPTPQDRIAADLKESERYKFDGVPAFIVNGRVIEGAQPADTFFEVIDAALHT